MKPVIGITTVHSKNETSESLSIGMNYIQAIRRAGGLPRLMLVTEETSEIEEQFSSCDGLLFIGGPDIDAHRYGLENHPEMHLLCPEHEDFLMTLAEHAIHHTRKPVLGICLGNQVLNVACGGSLFRHIPEDIPNALQHTRTAEGQRVRHQVTFTQDSPLKDIFGCEAMETNSSHHQAVNQLGKGLKAIAHTSDGVVEAICGTDSSRFLFGIQWHPEAIQFEGTQLNIFKALVTAAQ